MSRRWRLRRAGVPALLLGLLAGCGRGGDAASGGRGTVETAEFSPSLRVNLREMTRTSTGLYYRDLAPGDGPTADAGRTVLVRYTGWLPDGTQFDANAPGRPPFRFVLGTGAVIAGWDEGVRGMRVNGRRQLVIPSELGYGARGAPGAIPPNSVLVFEVEVVAIE